MCKISQLWQSSDCLVSQNQLRYALFGQYHLDDHLTLKMAGISQRQPTSEDQIQQHIQGNCFQTNVLIPVINKTRQLGTDDTQLTTSKTCYIENKQ